MHRISVQLQPRDCKSIHMKLPAWRLGIVYWAKHRHMHPPVSELWTDGRVHSRLPTEAPAVSNHGLSPSYWPKTGPLLHSDTPFT